MCRIHIIGINIWSFWRSFYLFLYCKFVYCWLFVYFEWKYNFFDIFISLNMFYKTSFLMRDSRSKRKNEILKMVLRDNFTLEGHFFQLRKTLRHLGNITKSHWVSRVETLKNEIRQYLSVDMLGAVFLTF